MDMDTHYTGYPPPLRHTSDDSLAASFLVDELV
jgi:hypothetical protein